MWNNGNWVSEEKNAKCDQVKFDPKTGVTSCYKDNNPVNEIKASNEGNGGIAVGSIRAGYSTLSNTIYVRNVLQPENTTPMVIAVKADATFRIPKEDEGVLAPGEYEATLDNFNLPDETVRFTIAANQQGPTYIAFIGQAVSSEPAEVFPLPTQTQCVQKVVDVKCKVDSLIKWYDWKQYIHIDADYEHLHYNALFGDPDVGTIKELRIVYKYEKVMGMRFLSINSAKYGTFCGETKVPKGYALKTVAEDVDMDIHYST
jgi:hypothetical protein